MSNSSRGSLDTQVDRKQIFNEVVDAFGYQYGWLGAKAARELLLSAASWNLAQHGDPVYRVRMHVMLAWKRGWLKSTILKKMSEVLGDDFCGMTGKVTSAAIRGSVSSGQFNPPKVSKKPILFSTEFGQTNFEDELLNTFLALLEEGVTNVNLNKIGGVSDTQKDKINNNFDGLDFGRNEFTVRSNFVFWGGTYDPTTLDDDALRQRFKIVTPPKPLEIHGHEIIDCLEENSFHINNQIVKDLRKHLKSDDVTKTDFKTPTALRREYNLEPRELGDLKRYMACRNWWGLDVNPEIMGRYIEHVKESRKIANMSKEDRVMDLILDNPQSYQEIMDETGYDKLQVYKILDSIGAKSHPTGGERKFVLRTGAGTLDDTSDDVKDILEEEDGNEKDDDSFGISEEDILDKLEG